MAFCADTRCHRLARAARDSQTAPTALSVSLYALLAKRRIGRSHAPWAQHSAHRAQRPHSAQGGIPHLGTAQNKAKVSPQT